MTVNHMQTPLFVIAGPTACGKTEIAAALALEIDGEVISADSMQVYKYMDIGTAKPTREEMRGVRHHLIDVLYPDEEFSVAVFQKMARQAVHDILARGKCPILAGGTGFYINALLHGNDFTEGGPDLLYRAELQALLLDKGNLKLQNMLADVDPASAEVIHPNNVKRMMRALEFFHQTGTRMSEHNRLEKDREIKYNTAFIVLHRERRTLYEGIDHRVDRMLKAGLEDEVGRLVARGYGPDLVSMQGIGYKEMVRYLDGELSLPEATEMIKTGSRRYAKRQLTWFRRQSNGHWIDRDDGDTKDIVTEIIRFGTSTIFNYERG